MEITNKSFEFGKKQTAAAIAIIATIILWAFLLNSTGIIINDFFTFKLQIILDKIISVNFALFLLAFPLTGAIIAAFAKSTDKLNLMLVATISGFVGLGIAMALFVPLQGFWLIALFYVISIPLRIETACITQREAKSFVSARTFLSATGKGTLVIGIGLFVLSATTILPEQDGYIEKFEETFIENVFSGFTTGDTTNKLAESQAELVVQSQTQTLNAMLDNPLFQNLKTKQDPDVIAFIMAAEQVEEQVKSPEYKEQIVSQLSQGTADIAQDIKPLKVVKEELPFLETLEQFLWLIHGFALVSIFFLAANIVFKPTAVLYGLILERVLGFGFAAQPAKKNGKKNN